MWWCWYRVCGDGSGCDGDSGVEVSGGSGGSGGSVFVFVALVICFGELWRN